MNNLHFLLAVSLASFVMVGVAVGGFMTAMIKWQKLQDEQAEATIVLMKSLVDDLVHIIHGKCPKPPNGHDLATCDCPQCLNYAELRKMFSNV